MVRKIAAVYPLEDKLIGIWFEPGEARLFDASYLSARGDRFAQLENPEVFARVSISRDRTQLDWGRGLKVSSEEVYEHSKDSNFVENEKRHLIEDLAEARKAAHFSQSRLGSIRQPVISRIEGGEVSPQVNTLFKLLAPLGKTLAVVDFKTLDNPYDSDADNSPDADEAGTR